MATAIVAYNKNFAIAEGGQIPWRLPEDFKHFKETTLGGSIIMGRKTYDSLPKRPLPGRLNVVVSRVFNEPVPGVIYANNLNQAFQQANAENPGQPVFIIGGEQIYNLAFEQGVIDKVIASVVDDDHKGDQFFPDLSQSGWSKKLIRECEGFDILEFTPS